MKETAAYEPPMWYWVLSVVALLWNLLGLMAFVMQVTMSDAAMAALPEAQQQLYEAMPVWVTVAFAVAVIGGVIGSLGLVVRKRWATPILMLSLVGVLAQMCYLFFLSDTIQVMGVGATVLPISLILVAIALVLFSRRATANGWLT